MSIRDLDREDLKKYISKKKDDEQKMMGMAGITIGAIILLALNIFINSLNDIPKILMINNWLNKFLFVFTLLYNLTSAVFFLLHLVYPGNNKELNKNHNELKKLSQEFRDSINKQKEQNKEKEQIEQSDIVKQMEELKKYFRKVKEIKHGKNEIDKKSLAFAKRLGNFLFGMCLLLNFYSVILLHKFAGNLWPLYILLIISSILASYFGFKKLYKPGTLLYFAVSLIFLVLIKNKYDLNTFLYNFIIFKYSVILCLFFIGISTISIFLTKFHLYKWLVNLEDRIYEEEMTDEDIKLEIEEIFLKRINVGFFNSSKG